MSSNRFSVYEAAEVMGVTVDAIRKRISRGTIPHERDDDGRVWVLLDTDQDAASKVQDTDRPQSDATALMSEMRGRIEDLRAQLEAERQAHAEARRIIAGLVERIPPAIEAPASGATEQARERPGGPQTAAETSESEQPRSSTGGPQERAEPRSWWRRLLR